MAAGPSRPDGCPQQAARSVPSRSIRRSAQAAHCARTRPAAAHRRSSPDPSDSPSAQRQANHKSENPSRFAEVSHAGRGGCLHRVQRSSCHIASGRCHCEKHRAKSAIADFETKRRSNPGANAAITSHELVSPCPLRRRKRDRSSQSNRHQVGISVCSRHCSHAMSKYFLCGPIFSNLLSSARRV